MEKVPTLLLIDGLNIVRRVFEANPTEDIEGKVQGALKACLGSFRRALSQMQPDYALAAFDHGGPTWRHELYPAYRQGRKPMPDLLRDALPGLRAELESTFGLRTISPPGVEADDVIACVQGVWARQERGRSIVMSTDKDLAELLVHGAEIRDHFKPEWRDAAWVEAKFGVGPHLLHDLLALEGDDVDGVPGVDGIGRKTAVKLLHEYGSLEAILSNAQEIKGAAGQNLRSQADRARLSRDLVSFRKDLTLGLTWSALRIGPVAAKPEKTPLASSAPGRALSA